MPCHTLSTTPQRRHAGGRDHHAPRSRRSRPVAAGPSRARRTARGASCLMSASALTRYLKKTWTGWSTGLALCSALSPPTLTDALPARDPALLGLHHGDHAVVDCRGAVDYALHRAAHLKLAWMGGGRTSQTSSQLGQPMSTKSLGVWRREQMRQARRLAWRVPFGGIVEERGWVSWRESESERVVEEWVDESERCSCRRSSSSSVRDCLGGDRTPTGA